MITIQPWMSDKLMLTGESLMFYAYLYSDLMGLVTVEGKNGKEIKGSVYECEFFYDYDTYFSLPLMDNIMSLCQLGVIRTSAEVFPSEGTKGYIEVLKFLDPNNHLFDPITCTWDV